MKKRRPVTQQWLHKQAKKLHSLHAKDGQLRLNYLALAIARGEILKAVKKVVPTWQFREWLSAEAKIGYSTALFWIDVHDNPVVVKRTLMAAHSNGLEWPPLTEIRDAIRDARQAAGQGKPGSGAKPKKKTRNILLGSPEDGMAAVAAAEAEASGEGVKLDCPPKVGPAVMRVPKRIR